MILANQKTKKKKSLQICKLFKMNKHFKSELVNFFRFPTAYHVFFLKKEDTNDKKKTIQKKGKNLDRH